MEYIRNTLDFHSDRPSAVTFGKFDGRHRGHELLVEKLLAAAQAEDLAAIVFTFDIPPKAVVDGDEAKVLTTNEEKFHIFEKAGIDCLIECPFTREVMQMEPGRFIQWVAEKLNVRTIVVGSDFRFGRMRGGDYRTLQELETQLGYHTIVLDKVKEESRDISSTYVREEIAAGRIEKANRLLGYDYFVTGTVVHGNRIGHTIGIPTINLLPPDNKLLPPMGVYVTRVLVGDRIYGGVSNVGRKPTIHGTYPVGVETYIIDFDQDVYGETVMVEFLHFVRPEMKFASIDELQGQMKKDIEYAKNVFTKSE